MINNNKYKMKQNKKTNKSKIKKSLKIIKLMNNQLSQMI